MQCGKAPGAHKVPAQVRSQQICLRNDRNRAALRQDHEQWLLMVLAACIFSKEWSCGSIAYNIRSVQIRTDSHGFAPDSRGFAHGSARIRTGFGAGRTRVDTRLDARCGIA